MRNKLVSYVDLVFAGNPEAEEIKEEILQNTLDRYDDLIEQGKTPEAAYSLAISGIGDLTELLSGNSRSADPVSPAPIPAESEARKKKRRLMRSVAVAMYILCPVPLFLIQDVLGLCLLLVMVAVATALIVFAGKDKKKEDEPATPQQKLKKSISSMIWTIGTVVYLIISFVTMAWHITWLVFPICAAVEGLVNACIDLKEGN